MSLTLVVGGEFGGEGKGAVVAYLAFTRKPDALVKTGGPNARHTFGRRGSLYAVRMLPSGANLGPETIIFPPGSLIHVETLFEEIEELKIGAEIIIDPRAGLIEEHHMSAQREDEFYNATGSSRRGTGLAAADRARRRLRLAGDETRLRPFLADTSRTLRGLLNDGCSVVIEGGQGFGLSNYHGDYPYVTSRDTTSAAALSQAGVGPLMVTEIILVVKCFPTRNPEGSGRLSHEIALDLDEKLAKVLSEEGGTPSWDGRKRRRVGLFDFDLVQHAAFANSPTVLAVTGFDKLDALERHPLIAAHYQGILHFREKLSRVTGVPIGFEGWGPHIEDMREIPTRRK